MKAPYVVEATPKFGSWQGKPWAMSSPHRHSEIECNFLEKGSMTYRWGGIPITLQAGHLAVFWAAVPHQVLKVEASAQLHLVALPLSWLLQWKLEQLTRSLLEGKVVIDPAPSDPSRDLAQFKRWDEDLNGASSERQAIAVLEIEARLRRLQLATRVPGFQGPLPLPVRARKGPWIPQAHLSKAEQMASYVAGHFREPVSVRAIAEAVGLHPNYAMQLYRKSFRVSLVESLTEHRVAHAQGLLASSDAKILDIALESGFGSSSRFYTAFSRSCGTTPRKFRESLRSRA